MESLFPAGNGFCGEQRGAGAGFLQVLQFPLPISTDCSTRIIIFFIIIHIYIVWRRAREPILQVSGYSY
jgi:hypothetical protein